MTFKTTKLRDAISFALVSGATALAGTGVAYAQDTEQEATTLDRIEVTGSRIKRTDIETSQPILTLSRDEISAQGLTSVGDVIQNITANGSTLNSTFNNGGNGETRVSLRNLGSARTLVLVNGRRWVGGTGLGGAVDLNTIPTAAVERIEVLKDGASAIYGSDAIAGVVNIILRTNFDGAEFNGYVGQYDKGDGSRLAADFTVGSSGERWSAMMGVGYVDEEPVFAGDREISAVPIFGSTPNLGGSSTSPDGRFCILDANFGCRHPDGQYGLWNINTSAPRGYSTYRGSIDNFNFAPLNYLLTPQERRSVFASGNLDITDDIRFKVTTTWNERKSEQLLAAMPVVIIPIFGIGAPTFGPNDVVISRNNVYNPYGQDIHWVQRRIVETGGRSFRQDVDTFAFNGGFEGTFTLGERFFDWEAGMFYGENDQNDTTNGLAVYSRLKNGLGPSFRDAAGVARCGTPTNIIPGCVPVNFLGGANNGSLTQQMLDYITFEAHDQFGYEQTAYYANVGGDLFDIGSAGPLAFSFGVEHREESGFDAPDAFIAAGDTTGNARTPTKGGYSVNEAYLEFAIPVLKDVPGAQLLDFSVATRYSDYSNFGNTLNSKFGFRWKPIDDLLVRGNWAEGFRAPSIAELFQGVSDSFPNLNDPCNATLFPGLDPAAQARCRADGVPAGGYTQVNTQIRISTGGNPNLLPETSVSKTLGFVYSPSFIEGFDISLDWWNIRLEDTITGFSGQFIADNCYRNGDAQSCGLITRGQGGAITDLLSAGLNIGSTEVEGYDMTVGYRMPETAWGKFSFIWDTTYLAKYENNDDGDNLAGEYFDRNNNWRIRSNLATRWEMGDWGATWNVRYYSGQDETCTGFNTANRNLLCSDPDRFIAGPTGLPVRAPENRMDATIYNDVSVYWNSPWNAKVALGVNNLFDEDPPFSASTFANSFDPQYEVPGRFYYMRYTQKF
ncbi:TonB-dependent receptor plug domain-containing protein [Luteimonas vadosa]|uniref:TonB-dependent receptor n=1 Tax=Luteimonas vadosa TaxID=1165507 RepID=A0ABP9DYI0_9GAMM